MIDPILPARYISEMTEWLSVLITSLPTENVSENVSEWAERERSLPSGLTARPGPFDFNTTPQIREIADRMSIPDPATEIVFVTGTQEGKTVGIIENALGYYIRHGIGPQLFVSGDQAMAEDSMATKIDDLIQSAGLTGLIQPVVVKKNGKATGDRKDMKSYAGTMLRAIGPNSESKARSFPAKINFLDEIDVYPQVIVKGGTSTGNPIEKILRRTDSYGASKKVFYTSTPKELATSQIWSLYLQGDKRHYMFNCPHCGHVQSIKWKNLTWVKNKDGNLLLEYREIDGNHVVSNDPVWLVCESKKKCKIKNSEKYDMLLEKGRGGTAEWIATKRPDRPGLYSYKSNALYGFRTWLDIAIHWQRVHNDPLLRPDFINDVLGEPTSEDVQKPDEHVLMQYAEEWPIGFINKNVLMLTLGVDVQKDRIEVMLVGWGRNRQAWVINYWTFPGNPAIKEDCCWNELDKLIYAEYMREDGELFRVTVTLIDQQFLTDTVISFCDQFEYHSGTVDGVYPVLVREQMQGLVKKMESPIGTPVLGISDQAFKKLIYEILKKRRPHSDGSFPHSYIHFSNEYGLDFYKQVTAEEFVTEIDKYKRKKTIIANTKRRRNEVLDTLKYNYAAFQYSIIEFFEAENKKRRANKRRELDMDLNLFFDVLEGIR